MEIEKDNFEWYPTLNDYDIIILLLSDPVEFQMSFDRKTGKPIACSVVKLDAGTVSFEIQCDDKVTGTVAQEARPPKSKVCLKILIWTMFCTTFPWHIISGGFLTQMRTGFIIKGVCLLFHCKNPDIIESRDINNFFF